jgi:hypothetical protein
MIHLMILNLKNTPKIKIENRVQLVNSLEKNPKLIKNPKLPKVQSIEVQNSNTTNYKLKL